MGKDDIIKAELQARLLENALQLLTGIVPSTEHGRKYLSSARALLAMTVQEERMAIGWALDENDLGTGDDLPPPRPPLLKAGLTPDPAEEGNVATCIGCGCTDLHACPVVPPCHWLKVDREKQTGVCSECEHMLSTWDLRCPGA